MSELKFQLPTRADGFDGLERLVDVIGAENFVQFVRWSRDTTDDIMTDFTATLAHREVEAVQGKNPDMQYRDAKIAAAKKWGYEGTLLANFNRLLNRYNRLRAR